MAPDAVEIFVRSIRRRSATMVAAAAAGIVGLVLSAGAGPVAAGTQAPMAARIGASAGNWGTAEEVPGTADLNLGGIAGVASVSCVSAGNCTAGGAYKDGSYHFQAFIAGQTNGTWGSAAQVPGTASLNVGGFAGTNSVSCPSAGNCGAGGVYNDGSGNYQSFVVSETNGTWAGAAQVTGTKIHQTLEDGITSMSCASAGNCSAGGSYVDGSGNSQAFIIGEKKGTWGAAKEVPGTAELNKGGGAEITSVSCASVGNCGAGGYYTGKSGSMQAFVVGETSGTWGTAEQVPGTAALNKRGSAEITSVSCAAAGTCSAGGYYDGLSGTQAFVVGETSGTWGTAKQVPGIAALNKGDAAEITSVSCATAGDCSAGGDYTDSFRKAQAFVVGEKKGIWRTAHEVPGTATLNQGGAADITSESCASPGNCGAGGYYTDSSGNTQALVVSQTNGTWGTAEQVPGTAALNQGGAAGITSVSCASPGNCSAGGNYTDSLGNTQAFVVSETNGT